MKKVFQKGFTLVELLIVIAVIGILAVAVLAAVDPIEQLRKSRDTARLADARELLNAYTRFNASKGCFPHQWTLVNGCNGAIANMIPATASNVAPITAHLTTMNTEQELKQTFQGKSSLARLFTGIGINGTPLVCFEAESRNFRTMPAGERSTINNPTTDPTRAAAGAACPTTGYSGNITQNCMICVL